LSSIRFAVKVRPHLSSKFSRVAKYALDGLNKQKNDVSKAVALKKKESKGQDKCEEEVARSKAIDGEIAEQKRITADAIIQQTKALNSIGNIVSPNSVISKTEDDNKVIRTHLEPNKDLVVDGSALGKLHHHEIMQCLDMVEFERGQKVAGHRGFYLKGAGVLLNQALINYGISTLMKKEYTPTQPPFFMKKEIMEATCQLSDFAENLYKVEGGDEGSPPVYLTATSEQPISAMHMGEWIHPDELPKRYAGVSTCFRKEAGSHGRDVWGIFRVHQFEKVEQFIYCDPNKSTEEFENMVMTAESFYQGLELPYQVINIASGALNDAASIKYDLEAWFPGYNAFRELVSCSNCTDYQSRALECRYAKRDVDDKLYVHMLNGTMCATERTMCCIVENYQTPEGVRVPKVLQPFMGGIEFLPYNQAATKKFFQAKEDEHKRAEEKANAKGGKGKGGKAEPKKQQPKKEEKKEEVKEEVKEEQKE
jgi:seryl-tRNA synthetase